MTQRGEYLTRAADCVACHTGRDDAPFAGGRPFRLPFGTIFSTNLTPDRDTGIGGWSDDAFVTAVRQGKSPRGLLYPAMPYTSYTLMSRDDVLAIKAYLMTLRPVRQVNRPAALSFPFNQRWAMALWNLVYFRDHRLTGSSMEDALWNRGAYLASALGHCAECHTPRDIGYGLASDRDLSGAEVQGWFAGNITPDIETGIGGWSDRELVAYLSTGHAEGRGSASGPMAEVVEHSLQYLDHDDVQALAAYLRRRPPIRTDIAMAVDTGPTAAVASSPMLPADSDVLRRDTGARLFAADCAGCHQWNGPGRQSPYASLVGSRAANDPKGRNAVQVILSGTRLAVGKRTETMPGFGGRYGDDDVAALANFVVGHFGGKRGMVTADQVKKQRGL